MRKSEPEKRRTQARVRGEKAAYAGAARSRQRVNARWWQRCVVQHHAVGRWCGMAGIAGNKRNSPGGNRQKKRHEPYRKTGSVGTQAENRTGCGGGVQAGVYARGGVNEPQNVRSEGPNQ